MSANPVLTPGELIPHAQRALDVLKDLTPEQQQAVLEAATGIARAVVELRSRLYMQGSILNGLNRR